jgi:hypothetical protein
VGADGLASAPASSGAAAAAPKTHGRPIRLKLKLNHTISLHECCLMARSFKSAILASTGAQTILPIPHARIRLHYML